MIPRLFKMIVRYGLILLVVLIVYSAIAGYVTFADIIKAVIIGMCVSTANWWHERNIRPRLEKMNGGDKIG